MNDVRWPWLILVPRRGSLVELSIWTRRPNTVDRKSGSRGEVSEKSVATDKINVGALGNIVRQLHLYVVARVIGDPAWPGPVWGYGAATPYEIAQNRGIADRSGKKNLGL